MQYSNTLNKPLNNNYHHEILTNPKYNKLNTSDQIYSSSEKQSFHKGIKHHDYDYGYNNDLGSTSISLVNSSRSFDSSTFSSYHKINEKNRLICKSNNNDNNNNNDGLQRHTNRVQLLLYQKTIIETVVTSSNYEYMDIVKIPTQFFHCLRIMKKKPFLYNALDSQKIFNSKSSEIAFQCRTSIIQRSKFTSKKVNNLSKNNQELGRKVNKTYESTNIMHIYEEEEEDLTTLRPNTASKLILNRDHTNEVNEGKKYKKVMNEILHLINHSSNNNTAGLLPPKQNEYIAYRQQYQQQKQRQHHIEPNSNQAIFNHMQYKQDISIPRFNTNTMNYWKIIMIILRFKVKLLYILEKSMKYNDNSNHSDTILSGLDDIVAKKIINKNNILLRNINTCYNEIKKYQEADELNILNEYTLEYFDLHGKKKQKEDLNIPSNADYPHLSKVTKAGIIYKLRSKSTKFHSRWLVLRGFNLYWYRKPE